MIYPKPDRSSYVPNLSKAPENDVLDIGWTEGILGDGRPYRLELWAQDQVTSVTVFLPAGGLETYTNEQFIELLEREHIVWWVAGGRESVYAVPITDAAGRPVWSINVVIGVDTDPPVANATTIHPYDTGSAA